MPPQAIATRLTARLQLLTGGVRDLPARQQALRTTMDWSYDLLTETERQLFRRLAVFAGGRTLEAIEAVCDPNGDMALDVLDGVSSLVDKSLLYERELPGGEVRFRMLETIQEYACEQLEKSGEAETLRRRHSAYFVDLAEQAETQLTGPQQAAWFERLEQEHDNFRAALAWAVQDCASAAALRLASALTRFWEVRGYLSEGRHWQEAALAAAKDDTGTAAVDIARAKALIGAGRLVTLQGDYTLAQALYDESVDILRSMAGREGTAVGDIKLSIVRALNDLAIVKEEQGNVQGARALYEQSLTLAREIQDQRSIAIALANLGVLAQHHGDFAGARPLHEESLAILRRVGDRRSIAVEIGNLGEVALGQGRLAEAQALYVDSLHLLQELGDKMYTPYFLAGLAATAGAAGDAERSGRLFGAAEALRETVGAPLPPSEKEVYDRMLATARAHLDEGAFEGAWSAGRTLPLEQALQDALDPCR
jgi:predicted ATPase